jgi:hypothetical protein
MRAAAVFNALAAARSRVVEFRVPGHAGGGDRARPRPPRLGWALVGAQAILNMRFGAQLCSCRGAPVARRAVLIAAAIVWRAGRTGTVPRC